MRTRSRSFVFILLPGLVLAGLAAAAASCTARYHPPNLGQIYDRAAQHHGPERNPIVVIPGLMGSTLEDRDTGRIVWGAFGGGSAKPQTPDGARLVALPMERGKSLAELRDGVVSTGVLDKLRVKLLGLPLTLKAYFYILGTLGAGGYQDESLALSGGIDYGDDHYSCFQFDYDWRRDNVENARRLHEFLLEKRAYVQGEIEKRFGVAGAPVQFDVVAHSMGGLITRYYLRYGAADLPEDGSLPPLTWKGAELIERAVLVAPPNAGSVEAVVELVEGRRFGPFGPKYPAALLGTFPAAYQLLPRPEHAQVVSLDDPSRPVEDLWEPELWRRMGWGLAASGHEEVLAQLLPEIGDAEERRAVALDHQAKCLLRARRFAAALDRPAPPPPGVDLYLVAGDSVPTPDKVGVDSKTGRVTVLEEGPGDGTVLRSSALMDRRLGREGWKPTLDSPVAWEDVLFLFNNHLGLTKDRVFTDNVLFWLLEEPR
jgi:hypothetical protein